ncbi:MAG: cytochrome-c oxidase, cbb3-type subunit III [Gammaproteobacteria bacterium]|nr:cytochrome-c oxidase, cbb3-type subunit III [Gammaproteobacteria bacterium]
MSDFFSPFWTFFISVGTLGGIAWMVYLLIVNSKTKSPANGESVQSTGHEWDGIEELNNPLPFWWVAMFYITIFFGVIYLILFPGLGVAKGALGWSSSEAHSQEVAKANQKYEPLYEKYAALSIPELAENEAAKRTGGRLFATYCSTCHGSDARGARGFPNLTDHDWLYGGSADQIKTTLLTGRQGNMPAWQTSLGDEGVNDVTSYVLNLSGREAPAEEIIAGEKIFTSMCAACHQADGTGMQALGAPNLTDDIWLYGASRGHIQKTIAEGRKGIMPAHEELLGEKKVHILAAYVYSLSQN